MASISRVFCNDATYVTPYVKEALDLGCRRKNWKQSKLINRVTGLVLRAPRVFNPKNKQDAFEIPGNPYLMTAFDYQRRNIRNSGGTDYVVMNENCAFVGVLTEFKNKRTTKCSLDLYLKPLPKVSLKSTF